jgi:predicted CXXCH cytochrome family protein
MRLRYLLVGSMTLLLMSNPLVAQEGDRGYHKECIDCHKEKDSKELKTEVNALCLGCHPQSIERDHPINIKPAIQPKNLPLDSEGKINCITCHEPHGKGTVESLLRMDFNQLCQECHKIRSK